MKTRLRILVACLCVHALCLTIARSKESSDTNVSQNSGTLPIPSAVVQLRGQKVDAHALRAKAKALQVEAGKKRSAHKTQEVEIEEAETLIKLASQKDPDLDLRRHQLIDKLRRDKTVPKDTRFRLAGISANIEVSRNRDLDPGQRMAAHAAVAWKLVEEFPDNPEGYASLLRIARDGDDTLAASIANQLLISKAPEHIKNNARALRSRIDLVGKPFAQVVADYMDLPTQGPVCLFTWSGRNPRSLGLAEILKHELPAGTTIVGVCVDGDTPEARAAAAAMSLPVKWVYPAGGTTSELCQQLLLTESAIYLVSAEGKINTVSGFNWLASHRWQKARGGRK